MSAFSTSYGVDPPCTGLSTDTAPVSSNLGSTYASPSSSTEHKFPPPPRGTPSVPTSSPGQTYTSPSPHGMSAYPNTTTPHLTARSGSVHSHRSSVAPEDLVFGTKPVGVIGKHKPREVVRVERDYSAGELCQFWSGWIWELEGRVSPTDFQNTMNELNAVLASAHDPYKSCFDNTLAVLTLYISPRLLGTHYEREMRKFDRVLERANRDIYNPVGLNFLNPRRTAFLFLEVEYY